MQHSRPAAAAIPGSASWPRGPRKYWLQYRAVARGFSPAARHVLAGSFLLALGQSVFAVQRNLYLDAAGFSVERIGRLSSAGQAGTVLAALLAPFLATRWSASSFLSVACLLAGFGSALTVALPPFPLMALGALAQGLGITLAALAIGPLFMRSGARSQRIYLFGIQMAVQTGANLIGSVASGELIRPLGAWARSPLGGYAVLLYAGAFLSAAALLQFRPLRSQMLPKKARRPLREAYGFGDRRLLLRMCLPELLIGLGASLSIHFLNLYFNKQLHVGAAGVGWAFAAMSATNVAGFLLVPVLVRRFGHVRTVSGAQLASLPFLLGMALTDRFGVGLACVLCRQVLMNMANPMAASFALEMTPEAYREQAASYRALCWNGGAAIGAFWGGTIIERTGGFRVPILLTLAFYLASTLLFIRFFRKRPR